MYAATEFSVWALSFLCSSSRRPSCVCSSNGGGVSTAAANTVLAAAPIVTYLPTEIGWECRYACIIKGHKERWRLICEHVSKQVSGDDEIGDNSWKLKGIWEIVTSSGFLLKKLDSGVIFFSSRRWAGGLGGDCWKLKTDNLTTVLAKFSFTSFSKTTTINIILIIIPHITLKSMRRSF